MRSHSSSPCHFVTPLAWAATLVLGCGREASSISDAGNPRVDANSAVEPHEPSREERDASTVDATAGCGWSGRQCQDTSCRDGVCESTFLAPACPPEDFPDANAQISRCGNQSASGMAIQDEHLVWALATGSIGGGALYRAKRNAPPTDCERVASSRDGNVSAPYGLTVHDGTVYWANQSSASVWRLERDAPTTPKLFLRTPAPSSPIASADGLFWVGALGAELHARSWSTGVDLTVHTAARAYAIADHARVGATSVFIDCANQPMCSILALDPGSNAPRTIASDQRYAGCLDADANRVVWSVVPTAGVDASSVREAPLSGGRTRDIASVTGTVIPGQVRLHDNGVLWITEDALVRADLDTGAVVDVARPAGGFLSRPCHQLATDAQYIYFITARGEVRRVAR